MSEKREVMVPAARLGLAIMALGMLQGDKPVRLSYMIGRIIDTLQTLQGHFSERIKPYVDQKTGQLREDVTEAERQEVEEILNEEITFQIHPISMQDLEDAGVTVRNENGDTVLPFLVQHGILTV